MRGKLVNERIYMGRATTTVARNTVGIIIPDPRHKAWFCRTDRAPIASQLSQTKPRFPRHLRCRLDHCQRRAAPLGWYLADEHNGIVEFHLSEVGCHMVHILKQYVRLTLENNSSARNRGRDRTPRDSKTVIAVFSFPTVSRTGHIDVIHDVSTAHIEAFPAAGGR